MFRLLIIGIGLTVFTLIVLFFPRLTLAGVFLSKNEIQKSLLFSIMIMLGVVGLSAIGFSMFQWYIEYFRSRGQLTEKIVKTGAGIYFGIVFLGSVWAVFKVRNLIKVKN